MSAHQNGRVAERKRGVAVLGGAWHDFEGFGKFVVPLLKEQGFDTEVSYDRTAFSRLDDSVDFTVIYTSLGGANDGKRVGHDLPEEEFEALEGWTRKGGAILAVHCATVNKSSPRYHRLIGASFESHPPRSPVTIIPVHTPHPVTEGIAAFKVVDELYIMRTGEDISVHMAAVHGKQLHPMVWTRNEGSGRVAYVGPGHDKASWNDANFRKLIIRGLQWITSAPRGPGR